MIGGEKLYMNQWWPQTLEEGYAPNQNSIIELYFHLLDWIGLLYTYVCYTRASPIIKNVNKTKVQEPYITIDKVTIFV